MRIQYPRTPHLPWSPGAGPDDLRITRAGADSFTGREIVVTEKLDGENTTLYRDGLHARSRDSGHHPSRTRVKALWARTGRAIPPGWRICGENMLARHSIGYDDLDAFFYGFSVWDDRNHCLGWDRTTAFLRGLGIPVPRVLWRGDYDERALRALRIDPARQEGYVVRTTAGFGYGEFADRVAKWVRPRHVRTDRHWMHSAVVENGRGPGAVLWDVRAGEPVTADELAAVTGPGWPESRDPGPGAPPTGPYAPSPGTDRGGPYGPLTAGTRLDLPEALAGLDLLGDERLTAALGLLPAAGERGPLAGRLAPLVGMRTARRVADLGGLRPKLYRPFPDEERRAGLVRLSYAADLRVLHTVAHALAPTAEARELTEWSALWAADAGLYETPAPWESWSFGGLGPDPADRCRAEARAAYARGTVGGEREAVAATWRWRDGAFPRLIQLVGPSGSGKSRFAAGLRADADRWISLDALREEAGDRADQRANADVLRRAVARLDAALAAGGTTVWDATGIDRHQRARVLAVAARRDALVTQAVTVVDPAELIRRNRVRDHPVPAAVLDRQLRRYAPPYPGEAHRTWYIGAYGTVEDSDNDNTGGDRAENDGYTESGGDADE
ncbi:RNA ligase family protein [Streptomyces sp. NPDC006798]|uniref:RNA ligase family protein n=1 Tax=Streptomyces sp. NPDC006798 TaxID=3155462 RepID=UPI0033DB849D